MTFKIKALLLAAGVTSIDGALAATPFKNTAQTLTGQVFIVSKAMQAIRLPLVTILAVPSSAVSELLEYRGGLRAELKKTEAACTDRLESAAAERRAAAAEKLPGIESKIAAAEMERSRLQIQIDEMKKGCSHIDPLSAFADYSKCLRTVGIIMQHQALMEQDDRLNEVKLEALQLRTAVAEVRPAPLPVQLDRLSVAATLNRSAVARSKSDADGRFVMKIERADVVLVAETSRAVGAENESYRWVVRLPPAAVDGHIEVTLANDNLSDSACDECIFIP